MVIHNKCNENCNVFVLTLTAFLLFSIDSEALDLFADFLWMDIIKSATYVKTNDYFFVLFVTKKKNETILPSFYIIKLAHVYALNIVKKTLSLNLCFYF